MQELLLITKVRGLSLSYDRSNIRSSTSPEMLTFKKSPCLGSLSRGEYGLHEYPHVAFRRVTAADDAETQRLLADPFLEHNRVQRDMGGGTDGCKESLTRCWRPCWCTGACTGRTEATVRERCSAMTYGEWNTCRGWYGRTGTRHGHRTPMIFGDHFKICIW